MNGSSVSGCFGSHQGNPFAAKVFFHKLRLVETEQSARIVDEHIEMGEEVLSEDASNPWIGHLNRPRSWMTTRGFNTSCEPASNESNSPTDAWK